MRNYKTHRVAPRLERVVACLIKCGYLQVAVRPPDGVAFFLVTFFGQAKEVTRTLTLS